MVRASSGANVTDYALDGMGQRVRKSGAGASGGTQVFS